MASLDWLHRFHDRLPGASDVVFGAADCGDGRSSYDHLADRVPPDAHRVLDLACGDGPLLARLRRPDRDLVGLDANGSELAAARARLASGPPSAPVRLIQGVAQELPFERGSFDAVVSHLALMLMDDPERVLAEIRRVLRPGGTFAFVVGREPSPTPLDSVVWRWLSARMRDEHLEMELGDPRWHEAETTGALLAPYFPDVRWTPLDAKVRVLAGELLPFLIRAYYPIEALSDEGKRALGAFLPSAVAPYVEAGALTWTFELRLGVAR